MRSWPHVVGASKVTSAAAEVAMLTAIQKFADCINRTTSGESSDMEDELEEEEEASKQKCTRERSIVAPLPRGTTHLALHSVAATGVLGLRSAPGSLHLAPPPAGRPALRSAPGSFHHAPTGTGPAAAGTGSAADVGPAADLRVAAMLRGVASATLASGAASGVHRDPASRLNGVAYPFAAVLPAHAYSSFAAAGAPSRGSSAGLESAFVMRGATFAVGNKALSAPAVRSATFSTGMRLAPLSPARVFTLQSAATSTGKESWGTSA